MTIDWSGIVTSITSGLAPAVTAALPIAGTILGIKVAFKLFKMFGK